MKHNIREHGRTKPVLPFRLPEKRISGKTGRMKLCGESAFCRKNPCGTNCLLPGLHFSPIYAIIMLAAAAGNCTGCTAYVNDTAGFYDTDGDSVYLHAGTKIILRTASGCYLSPDSSGRFYADKTEIDDSCQLRIETTEDSYTGFWHMMTGTYASAQSFLPPL